MYCESNTREDGTPGCMQSRAKQAWHPIHSRSQFYLYKSHMVGDQYVPVLSGHPISLRGESLYA